MIETRHLKNIVIFIQTISSSFIFSKDSDGTRTMRTKSNNVEIIIGSKTDEIIEYL